MVKDFKKSMAKQLLPRRAAQSHKGENGRVLIIGGCMEYYAPPVLAGLGAIYSGADLVYLYVPECNFDVCRSLYPDFIVKKFPGEYFTERAADAILDFAKEKCNSVLIGPGIGKNEHSIDAVLSLLNELHLPTVIDADALQVLKKVEKFPLSQPIVITPHQNEFRHLTDRDMTVKPEDPKSFVILRSLAMDLHLNILLKGAVDYIASYDGLMEANRTGNAGMTVGGSGDVLAGVVASFLAQGLEAYDAARVAAYYLGRSGDLLYKQKGVNYSASDLAMMLPYALK